MNFFMEGSENLASDTPLAQWFYRWVREMNLQTPYPSLQRAKAALEKHLPELYFRRHSRHVPDLESGESWMRSLLRTGELIHFPVAPGQPPLTIAVYVTNGRPSGYEKICSPEFSAVRRELGIDKHFMIVMSQKQIGVPDLTAVIESLVRESGECAFVDLTKSDVLCGEPAI